MVDKAWELNHQVDFSTGEEPEALNMIGGVHFVRWAMGLQEKRLTASKKVQEYNLYCPKGATVESLAKGQKHLLVMILGRLGEESEIQPPLSLVYGCNTSVGQEVYAESGYAIELQALWPYTDLSACRSLTRPSSPSATASLSVLR